MYKKFQHFLRRWHHQSNCTILLSIKSMRSLSTFQRDGTTSQRLGKNYFYFYYNLYLIYFFFIFLTLFENITN